MNIDYDFEASVGYWVTITAISFRRAMNEELAPLGITQRQFQVLGWLALEGKLSQSELACRMDIEPPTLAGIVDRMEASGWVRRVACENDRRRKYIQMQPAAEPVWEQIAACARRIRSLATQGFSEEETDQVRSLLRLMHENLGRREERNGQFGTIAASHNCSEHTRSEHS